MPCDETEFTGQGSDTFGGSINTAENAESMGKEERKQQVLQILDESGLALTPYVLFRNAKMRGSTFERRTLSNYLSELVEEGRVEKIVQDDETNLYRITDEGRKSLSSD